jgi:hypothetical protein
LLAGGVGPAVATIASAVSNKTGGLIKQDTAYRDRGCGLKKIGKLAVARRARKGTVAGATTTERESKKTRRSLSSEPKRHELPFSFPLFKLHGFYSRATICRNAQS